MKTSLKDINLQRKNDFFKNRKTENFLENLNNTLLPIEQNEYKNNKIEFPFIFIFGLPRSGTTLISQVISSTFDVGYINNIAARFFLAPVNGINLSRAILGERRNSDFNSNYALTNDISDIHDFGYFWRYWLKKEYINDIVCSKEKEAKIDWTGLKKALSNIQCEFNKPFVFKNIYGAYHLEKLKELLDKVIYIYIERDELDVAVSILGARKKFNTDLDAWWSTIPFEYNKLKDMNYIEQIAGQVFYLKKFYQNEIKKLPNDVIRINYKELCETPISVIERIKQLCINRFNYKLKIIKYPPVSFPYRTYNNSMDVKEHFKNLLGMFGENQP